MFSRCPTCAHRCELPWLLRLEGLKVGVEVGVLHGNYSRVLLRICPGLLHLIDPWESYPEYVDRPQDHEHNHRQALQAVAGFPKGQYQVWRERSSISLADRIGTVDYAYIDGNHAYQYVMKDMLTWWEHLKPGGFLAGHDIFQMEHPGVTEAVVLFAQEQGKNVFLIPGKDGCECGDGGVPSWYIRKS